MMKRIAVLLYGVVSYAISFATILYLIGFSGNLIVPKSVDSGEALPAWQAIAINILLVVVFAIQHSVMARPWFKAWVTKLIPEAIERSTYMLFTVAALGALFAFWQPVGGVVWEVENNFLVGALWALFALGWTIMLVSSFLINHFDLFGLRQVWFYFIGKPYEPLSFKVPLLYKWVRHPLYLGLLLGFWAAPVMTATRLFYAVLLTLYILKAIRYEEKDLVNFFGEKYRQYAEQVPMILPSIFGRRKKDPAYQTLIKGDH